MLGNYQKILKKKTLKRIYPIRNTNLIFSRIIICWAGEPEPGVFDFLEPEPEPLGKKKQEPEPLGKKVRRRSR